MIFMQKMMAASAAIIFLYTANELSYQSGKLTGANEGINKF